MLRDLTPRSRSHFRQKNSVWSVTKPEPPKTPALEDNKKIYQELKNTVKDLRKSVGQNNQAFFSKRNPNINKHISLNSTSDQVQRKQFVRVTR